MEKMDLARTAVVTIDYQVDYFPGWRFPLQGAVRAFGRGVQVLDAARKAGVRTFHIQHLGLQKNANFLAIGTPGAELRPGLVSERRNEYILQKHFPDSFLKTDLESRLRDSGVDTVIWMGMITWMCVDTTVRSAKAKGFTNILVEDACAAGWMEKGGWPVFPWVSHRAFMAALGFHHATVAKSSVVEEVLNVSAAGLSRKKTY